jgi:hypothetical protein
MALTPKQRRGVLEKGLSINLTSTDDTKYLSPNPKAATQLFAKPQRQGIQPETLPSDGRPGALPSDGLLRQTVDREHYRQTVLPDYRQTVLPDYRQTPISEHSENSASLPADRLTEEASDTDLNMIPLAPIQWAIWEALRAAAAAGRVVSYRKLAQAAKASSRGVRDAFAVIEKEGGIRSKVTVRTPDEQGMRIELDTLKPFRPASLKETKGLLKRDGNYRQTVNRKSAVLPSDGLRLSVCINKYILQTDVAELLQLFPPAWSVRERTVVEIVRSFPEMTLLEYRRSLLLLIDQATKSHTPIHNHNAWLKAAFAKNEGPLVTERMIEAQLDHIAQGAKGTQAKAMRTNEKTDLEADFAALRRYVNATSAERAVIERAAAEKVVPALRVTPGEKHGEIREQAIIEAAREFFAKNPPEE